MQTLHLCGGCSYPLFTHEGCRLLFLCYSQFNISIFFAFVVIIAIEFNPVSCFISVGKSGTSSYSVIGGSRGRLRGLKPPLNFQIRFLSMVPDIKTSIGVIFLDSRLK